MKNGFEDWYQDYPRKEAKKNGEKAYSKALEDGVSHERMTEGLARFNEDIERRPRERKFIPLPASWINAGRYDDEYPWQNVHREIARIGPRRPPARPRDHSDDPFYSRFMNRRYRT